MFLLLCFLFSLIALILGPQRSYGSSCNRQLRLQQEPHPSSQNTGERGPWALEIWMKLTPQGQLSQGAQAVSVNRKRVSGVQSAK